MDRIKSSALRLLRDEDGATMVEYALLVALIAVALIVTVTALKSGIDKKFTAASDALK